MEVCLAEVDHFIMVSAKLQLLSRYKGTQAEIKKGAARLAHLQLSRVF